MRGMIDVELQVDLDVADAFAETAVNAPSAVRRIAGQVARGDVAQAMINELAFIPGKPRYPLAWTSDRQRKAVIMKLKREGRLGRSRTGKHARAWRVVVIDAAVGQIALQNNEPGTAFIYGPFPFRQRMHGETGWPFMPVIVTRYQPKLQDALIDGWLKYNGVSR